MKKIDKSAVMQRAWKIYRGNSEYSWSFSRSLKRAWWVEKENAREVPTQWVCSAYGLREYVPEPVRNDKDYDINANMLLMADTISSAYSSGISMGD
jgi:hypothetical protein